MGRSSCAGGRSSPARALGGLSPRTVETHRANLFAKLGAESLAQLIRRYAALAMMEGAQKNPAAANLVHIPGFLLLGAVGVGGAPGGHLDEQCALAAIDKVKELLK